MVPPQSNTGHGNRGGGALHNTATVDVAGFMSAADKTALDSIAGITALADPNADRLLFWDDSLGNYAFLALGSGLSIAGTTISASGAGLADGDYGDITVSGSGTVMTIDAGVVTLAMMADLVAQSKNVLTANTTITAGYSAYIPYFAEIADTIVLEIGLNSVLEIG